MAERSRNCAGDLERSRGLRFAGRGIRHAQRPAGGDSVRLRPHMDRASGAAVHALRLASPALEHDRRCARWRAFPRRFRSIPPIRLPALFGLLAYAGIFWISLQYSRRAARARQVMLAVVYSGFGYALYGLVVQLIGSDSILIFRKGVYVDDLTSTFIDADSFATYSGLALVCCTGLSLVLITQALGAPPRAKARPVQHHRGLRRTGLAAVSGVAGAALALILSHSRTGFLSTLLGLLSLVVAAGLAKAVDRRLALAFGAVCVAGLGWTLGVNGDQPLARLLQTSLTRWRTSAGS